MLSLDTAYRSFGGEVEASSTPTICRLSDSRRHQLWAIAQVDTSGGKSQTAIVGMIAAGVAVNVGAVAGALVPFCALLLIGALRIGKNAYCSGIPLDVPAIESKAKKTVAKKKIAKKK
jgi:hypothetical protein